MAERIWILFGMVSGVSRGIGVLDRGGYHRRGRGCLEGEYGASNCNQFWFLLYSCVEVSEPIELSFGVVSGMGPGIDVQNGGPRGSMGKGSFL